MQLYILQAYGALQQFDSGAVWVMQSWFLVQLALCKQGNTIYGNFTGYCDKFWNLPRNSTGYPRAEAYLSGVPVGQ